MFYRIIATFALSFIFYIGSSQTSYHRLYETSLNDPSGMNDTIFYHMSSTTISGDVYAMGTKRVGEDDLSIIFTKHNDKGNIDWSKELDLGQDTVDIQSIGNFKFNGTLDSMLFVINVEINGALKEIFGRLSTAGDALDLKSVGGNQFATLTTIPDVAPFVNQSDLLLTPGDQPTISRIGLGDDLLWSQTYEFTDNDGNLNLDNITDITSTPDSTIILTGSTSGTLDEFVVAELDSNGVQIWAESYAFSSNPTAIVPTEVKPLTNGDFAVVGFYIETGATSTNSFVTIIDSAGTIITTKDLAVSGNSTSISNLVEGTDGTLWMSGTYQVLDSTKYFITNMDVNGIINWTTVYGDMNLDFVSNPFTSSLLNVQATGGAVFVGHGLKDDLRLMQVMKLDQMGDTPCSDTITTIVEDLMTIADTLTSQPVNGGIFFDLLDFELTDFSGFLPPTLTINEYPPFCPNEVIDTLLIASVSNVADENVSYEWSTGEFTDTIRVTMEGQYSVTVTITEDICYTMCDTIELTRLMVPQIEISQDDSRFCLEQIIVLNGDYTPGAQGETFIWSTGEMTQSIEVTEEGLYSVTVTDECGEMASDELNVSFPDLMPSASIAIGPCSNGASSLIVNYTGIAPQVLWSTGESSDTIFVTSDGSYTVTVTDACGESTTESINFTSPESSITGAFSEFNVVDFCTNGGIKISAVASSSLGPLLYSWSNGFEETTNAESSITVTEDGEYQVTISDVCGATEVLSESISIPVLPSTGEILFEFDCDLQRITFSRTPDDDPLFPKLNIVDLTDGSNSENEITDPISLELHTYFVELVFCDNLLDSLTINASSLCGVLDYPVVFFPGGADEQSRTFGPIPSDTMSIDRISDVDFKVFNRWGEMVFESDAILDAWDGSHKGDPAPSEVYIWYVSYILDGQEILDKGDVTLIR